MKLSILKISALLVSFCIPMRLRAEATIENASQLTSFSASSTHSLSPDTHSDIEAVSVLSDAELKETQGAFWPYLAGAAVGGISGGISSGISSYADKGRVDWYSVASGTAGGAVGGLVSPVSAFSAIGRPIVSGALGGITSSAFNTYVKRW